MRRIPSLVPLLAGLAALSPLAMAQAQPAAAGCTKPVYLTLDTGHMGPADQLAGVLSRQKVRATFFASNERTATGISSLNVQWGPWWKARAAEGHEFASRTYDPVAWRGDLPGLAPKFRVRHMGGGLEGREFTWDAAKYCENIEKSSARLKEFTGRQPLPLFRAPDGSASPRLLEAAKSCGYVQVGWSTGGALALAAGQPSAKKGRKQTPLERLLKTVRPGDILQAEIGGSPEADAAVQELLEPLIAGLKEQGFCFATLREHPAYREWIAAPKPAAPANP